MSSSGQSETLSSNFLSTLFMPQFYHALPSHSFDLVKSCDPKRLHCSIKPRNSQQSYLPSFQISAASFQSLPTFSHTTRYLPVTSCGVGPLVLRLKVPISRTAEGPHHEWARCFFWAPTGAAALGQFYAVKTNP